MRKKTKVIKLVKLVDEFGGYIPFCDFKRHVGYVRTPKICERRDCKYYLKLRIVYNGERKSHYGRGASRLVKGSYEDEKNGMYY